MNVFKSELKAYFKSALFLTLGLCLAGVVLLSVFPTYHDSRDDVVRILAGFPPAALAAFGMDIENMFSFNGFYAFICGYLLLIFAILSSYFSISIFTREIRNKASDFLLTKPASRTRIFVSKLSACLAIVIACAVVFLVFAVIMFDIFEGAEEDFKNYLLMNLSIPLTGIVFVAFCTLISVTVRKMRSPSAAAQYTGYGFFIVSMFAEIIDDEKLFYLTPLKYFNPSYVFLNGRFELKFALVAAAVTVLFLGASLYIYNKKDIQAA